MKLSDITDFGTALKRLNEADLAWEIITPEKAQEIIDGNPNNHRMIRDDTINSFAGAIMAGSMDIGFTTIVIEKDGFVKSGLVLLRGVIRSNKSVISIVIRNMPNHIDFKSGIPFKPTIRESMNPVVISEQTKPTVKEQAKPLSIGERILANDIANMHGKEKKKDLVSVMKLFMRGFSGATECDDETIEKATNIYWKELDFVKKAVQNGKGDKTSYMMNKRAVIAALFCLYCQKKGTGDEIGAFAHNTNQYVRKANATTFKSRERLYNTIGDKSLHGLNGQHLFDATCMAFAERDNDAVNESKYTIDRDSMSEESQELFTSMSNTIHEKLDEVR